MFDNPVFRFEVKSLVRHRRSYAARSAFVAALLATLAAVQFVAVDNGGLTYSVKSIRGQAEVGSYFTLTIMGTQLALVLLAAPAIAAGSICVDKARGTLAHILVTDLSAAEVLLGKLAGRIATIGMVLACSWPVSALAALLGGVDPILLNHALLIAAGVGLVSCSLSLALSVWGRKTHEVLILSYLLLGAWVFARPTIFILRISRVPWLYLPEWYESIDPAHLTFGPYTRPGSVSPDQVWFFLAFSAVASGAMLVPAILDLRRSLTRTDRVPKKRRIAVFPAFVRLSERFAWAGPSLDDNPVLWREWRARNKSLWWRATWGAYWLCSIGGAYVFISTFVQSQRTSADPSTMLVALIAAAGFLLLSVVSSTSLSEERVRGSLDVLLTTPMNTRSIVWGKWMGTYRLVLMIMVIPVFMAAAVGVGLLNPLLPLLVAGIMAAQGAVITTLGLFCAIMIERPGRAAAWCVACFLLVTIGWVFLAVIATMRAPGITGPGLASFSIVFGTLLPMITAQELRSRDWGESIAWVLFWTMAQAGIAGFLYAAVLQFFDRKMGRISSGWERDASFDGLWERYHRPEAVERAGKYWPSGEMRPPSPGVAE